MVFGKIQILEEIDFEVVWVRERACIVVVILAITYISRNMKRKSLQNSVFADNIQLLCILTNIRISEVDFNFTSDVRKK